MNPEGNQLWTTLEHLDAGEAPHLCCCLQVNIVNADTCSAHNLQATFAGLENCACYLKTPAHFWIKCLGPRGSEC